MTEKLKIQQKLSGIISRFFTFEMKLGIMPDSQLKGEFSQLFTDLIDFSLELRQTI